LDDQSIPKQTRTKGSLAAKSTLRTLRSTRGGNLELPHQPMRRAPIPTDNNTREMEQIKKVTKLAEDQRLEEIKRLDRILTGLIKQNYILF